MCDIAPAAGRRHGESATPVRRKCRQQRRPNAPKAKGKQMSRRARVALACRPAGSCVSRPPVRMANTADTGAKIAANRKRRLAMRSPPTRARRAAATIWRAAHLFRPRERSRRRHSAAVRFEWPATGARRAVGASQDAPTISAICAPNLRLVARPNKVNKTLLASSPLALLAAAGELHGSAAGSVHLHGHNERANARLVGRPQLARHDEPHGRWPTWSKWRARHSRLASKQRNKLSRSASPRSKAPRCQLRTAEPAGAHQLSAVGRPAGRIWRRSQGES